MHHVIAYDTTKSLGEELYEKIVGEQIVRFGPITDSTTQIENIFGQLNTRTNISTILSNYKMENDQVKLCNLSGKQFKLLYRATRDRFEASCFHAKCDNQPRTQTIIRTTKGYVFGAYIDVTWDSTSCHKSDPNAFIFSLINARKLPLWFPIKSNRGADAIYCCAEYGPARLRSLRYMHSE